MKREVTKEMVLGYLDHVTTDLVEKERAALEGNNRSRARQCDCVLTQLAMSRVLIRNGGPDSVTVEVEEADDAD